MAIKKEEILRAADEVADEVISHRRHFHKHPELSYKEFDTAAYICAFLDKAGIPYKKGIAGTGIVAWIEGKTKGGKNIGLRADMDALPVRESGNLQFKSMNEGVMHACGHDAHMAMLMGSGLILNSLRDKFGGKFILIFQPGEELAPGGAKLMIDSGIFSELKPDIVLAQHVLPELIAGKVGYKPGRYMASCDEIYITIRGKGGHAAQPALTTDQIYIASKLVIRLKDEIARAKEEKGVPTVLGIGRIRGDGATNVIPETVEIAGTFRTFDESWRSEAKDLMMKIAADTAGEYNLNIDMNIVPGYPVLNNNEYLAERAVQLSSALLGSDKVEHFDIRMGSEDFSFFSEVFPSLYFRVGIGKEGEAMKMLHTPAFEINETGLKTGVANMTWLALNFMDDPHLPG